MVESFLMGAVMAGLIGGLWISALYCKLHDTQEVSGLRKRTADDLADSLRRAERQLREEIENHDACSTRQSNYWNELQSLKSKIKCAQQYLDDALPPNVTHKVERRVEDGRR